MGGLGAPLLVVANRSSSSFLTRSEQSVHACINRSRSGHRSLVSVFTGALPTTQIPTNLQRLFRCAKPAARLPTPLMGIQCARPALRIPGPGHPCATWPISSLECQSSRMPGLGLGNCPRGPLVAWVDADSLGVLYARRCDARICSA
jgi:hypothetical protein